MLILLEGVNGVGKTTLINKLIQLYPFKVYKEPRHLIKNIKDLLHWRETTGKWLLEKWRNHIVLLDRYHISTLIYNVIMNKELSYSEYLQHYQKIVKPDLIIILTAPLDIILTRRPHLDKNTVKRLLKLYSLYACTSDKARLFSNSDDAFRFISSCVF